MCAGGGGGGGALGDAALIETSGGAQGGARLHRRLFGAGGALATIAAPLGRGKHDALRAPLQEVAFFYLHWIFHHKSLYPRFHKAGARARRWAVRRWLFAALADRPADPPRLPRAHSAVRYVRSPAGGARREPEKGGQTGGRARCVGAAVQRYPYLVVALRAELTRAHHVGVVVRCHRWHTDTPLWVQVRCSATPWQAIRPSGCAQVSVGTAVRCAAELPRCGGPAPRCG
jgi:hypothetical protein